MSEGVFTQNLWLKLIFYMKEILDEEKSVWFIHLYPSVVQINKAKKMSDEPLS